MWKCNKIKMAKLTKQQFIIDAVNKYGNKFNYDLLPDIMGKTEKVIIICKEHGSFVQEYRKHIKSFFGCPMCAVEAIHSNQCKSSVEFINQAIKTHGDYYDYSKVDYKKNNKPVIIICPIHGEFNQLPTNHLRSQYRMACLKCSDIEKGRRKANKASTVFINKAIEVHGNKYDYSKVDYISATDKVIIICPKHGEFLQQPSAHFSYGCLQCGIETRIEKSMHSNEFILNKFKEIHGNRYDYSLVEYTGYTNKVKIICKIHGIFLQAPSSHIDKKSGCPECSRLSIKEKNTCSLENFIEKSRKVYGDIFTYDNTVYVSSTTPVIITCKQHGDFTIWPESHYFNGAGCPKCNEHTSKGEKELVEFIKNLGTSFTANDRILIGPYELDVLIIDKKIAIEYNGIYYHNSDFKNQYYHLNKTQACNKVGYDLIHVWEDDWIEKKEIIKSLVKSRLGIVDRVIYGRKTIIKEVTYTTVKDFLDKNHIQGAAVGSIYLGLFFEDELVAASVFSKYKDYLILDRHACLINTKVLGALGKVIKFVSSTFNKKIVTFCDISMYTGKSYEVVGFKKDKTLLPDYSYVMNGKRIHKFNFRKKIFANKYKLDIENKTEEILRNEMGLKKIYDCGKIRYVYYGDTL